VGVASIVGSVGSLAADHYDFTVFDGTLTINKAHLTVMGTSVTTKIYDGSKVAELANGGLVGVLPGDLVVLKQAGEFVDKNVGEDKSVVAGDTIDGADSSNYVLTQPIGLTANIIAKSIQIAGLVAQDKVYDGTAAAKVSSWGALSGLVGSETLLLIQGAASFADANPGLGKPVTASGYRVADGDNGGVAGNCRLLSTSVTTTASILVANTTASTDTSTVVQPSVPALSLPALSYPLVFRLSVSSQPLGGNSDPVAQLPMKTLSQSTSPEASSKRFDRNAGDSTTGEVAVSLLREPTVGSTGVIAVSVPKELVSRASGFSFSLPTEVLESVVEGASISVTSGTGTPLPGWLRCDPASKTFSASAVEEDAFPMQIIVTANGLRSTIVISERDE
jgi:hypothetical protein